MAWAVMAHGAGNDLHAPFLAGAAQGLAANGVSTMRFNFPFTEEGRREAWRAALAAAAERAEGLPLVASGKSLGGRIASMLAAEDPAGFPCRALVFFGYPLHAPGRPDKPRDAHLPAVRVPMLFIQGTSDALASFDLIEALVERLRPLARLHVVQGGDHSFRVRGARRPDDDIGRELGHVAAEFITEVVS